MGTIYNFLLAMTSEELAKKKYEDMTTKKVSSLVVRFAIPSVISMLITSIYNLVDTFFVGDISTQATAAIGVVFAYSAVIQALAFFFGHGSGNFISRALGAKDRSSADKMAANGFFTSFFVGSLIGLLGLIFMKPLLTFLGSTETILPEAESYFVYIAIATPFIMSSLVLNNLMRFQGNAAFSMIGIGAGALLNIGLDPLLIKAFNMGVSGAGLATAISQFVSWVLLFLLSRKGDGVLISFRNYKPTIAQFLQIIRGGLPSLGRQGLMSIASIVLNNAAKAYVSPELVDSAIAAFTVVSRATNFAACIVIGFGQGFQPVCGFNFGAKKYDRVKKAFWFTVISGTIYGALMGLIGYLLAPQIIMVFRDEDPELIVIGAATLRFNCFTFVTLAFVTLTNMYLQTINRTIPATLVAMTRSGLFFIPLVYILGSTMNIQGLEMAQMFADIGAVLFALPFALYALKSMSGTKELATHLE